MQNLCDVIIFKYTGVTKITAKNSRDHTEKMFQSLKIPIKLKRFQVLIYFIKTKYFK